MDQSEGGAALPKRLVKSKGEQMRGNCQVSSGVVLDPVGASSRTLAQVGKCRTLNSAELRTSGCSGELSRSSRCILLGLGSQTLFGVDTGAVSMKLL